MTYVKVSSKYQITIPKDVGEALGLEAGDRLYIGLEGSKIVLQGLPKVENPTERLYGSVQSNKDAVKAIREFKRQEARLEY